MCRYAYPQEILIQFFSGSNAPFWTLKFDENERYYWNSSSAQLRWISWNFVVMKNIMCRYAFYKKCWFYLFKEQFISLFCPMAHSLELPFIVYSTLKQCWSVGYVSLLTLSFILLICFYCLGYVLSWDICSFQHTSNGVKSLRTKTISNKDHFVQGRPFRTKA